MKNTRPFALTITLKLDIFSWLRDQSGPDVHCARRGGPTNVSRLTALLPAS